MVDEELVEVREATHPSDVEEARWWPGSNGRDEIGEPRLSQCEPSSFREPAPRARDDESRRGEKVVFTQDEVGREVVRCPRIEQRRRMWSELFQQFAELLALDGVEEHIGHAGRA